MFVSLRPPEPVVEALAEFLEPRASAAPFPFVRASQWHLTLAFMASVSDRALDDLEDRLAGAARRHEPFVARFGGAGAFPDPTRAKVLWLGLAEGEAQTSALAGHVRTACEVSGVPTDAKGFVPHLTLARLRRPVEGTRWLRVLDSYTGPAWTVDEVELVASHLHDGRLPRHEVVATYPLGDDRAGTEPTGERHA